MARIRDQNVSLGKRGRDRTGEVHGPYRVTRPFPRNSGPPLYYYAACPLCGFELLIRSEQLTSFNGTKGCAKCRRNAFTGWQWETVDPGRKYRRNRVVERVRAESEARPSHRPND